MAFESSKNSVVEQLCGTVALPKMVRVRQEFDHTHMEPRSPTQSGRSWIGTP